MHSEDRSFQPESSHTESEPIPKLQRRTIHPDSLKFMDMAKDLLDSPVIQQAMEGGQQSLPNLDKPRPTPQNLPDNPN